MEEIEENVHTLALTLFVDEDNALRVPEFIEYYLTLGVDHFFVINHVHTRAEKRKRRSLLEEFAAPYVKRGILTIVRWPHEPICQGRLSRTGLQLQMVRVKNLCA